MGPKEAPHVPGVSDFVNRVQFLLAVNMTLKPGTVCVHQRLFCCVCCGVSTLFKLILSIEFSH